MALPLPNIYRGQSRPVKPLNQGHSVGTAFRDKLLHSGLSWPRYNDRCHPCTRAINDSGTWNGKTTTSQEKENNVDKADTKTNWMCKETQPSHTPKNERGYLKLWDKRVLLELHVCGMNSPSITPAEKRRKEPGNVENISLSGSAPRAAPWSEGSEPTVWRQQNRISAKKTLIWNSRVLT